MLEFFVRIQDALLAFLNEYGYLGLAIYVFVEESGIPFPIPADTGILVMGYQVYRGAANPVWVVAVTVAAATSGASVLYWIARVAGRRLIARYGRFLHLTPARLVRVERWFDRYEVPAVVIGRLIPGFRIVITVVAGIAKGNFPLFVFSAGVSSLIWAVIFVSLGWGLGGEYDRVVETARGNPLIQIGVTVGLLIVAAGFVAYRLRHRALRRKAARTEIPPVIPGEPT